MRLAKPSEITDQDDASGLILSLQSQINDFINQTLADTSRVHLYVSGENPRGNEIMAEEFALRPLVFHHLLNGIKGCFRTLFEEFCSIYAIPDVRAFGSTLSIRRAGPQENPAVHPPIWCYLKPLSKKEYDALNRFVSLVTKKIAKVKLSAMFKLNLVPYAEENSRPKVLTEVEGWAEGTQYAVLLTFMAIASVDENPYEVYPSAVPSDPHVPEQYAVTLEQLSAMSIEELAEFRNNMFYERFIFYIQDIQRIGRCLFRYLKETNQ